MNTQSFTEANMLKQTLENLTHFAITDGSILDLIDEHHINIKCLGNQYGAFTKPDTFVNQQEAFGKTSRIAVLNLLIKLYTKP